MNNGKLEAVAVTKHCGCVAVVIVCHNGKTGYTSS